MAGDIDFIDADSFTGKKGTLSFREIVLNHLRKVIALQSEEMRGGFWVTRFKHGTSSTVESKEYIPDSRERFGGSVDALYDLMLPTFGEKMNKISKEINAILEQSRLQCLKDTKKDDKEVLSSDCYTGDDKQVVEEYRFIKLRHKRRLFQELSLELKRRNYFEGRMWEGE